MEAVLSGQAGVAILINGNDAVWTPIDSPELEFSCALTSIPYLLADANDAIYLKHTTKQEAVLQLKRAWQFDRALHLSLILLDSTEDDETRSMASNAIPGLLEDPAVRDRLLNFLYSRPIPEAKAIEVALRLTVPESNLASMLSDLMKLQGTIRALRLAWDNLPLDLFENGPARDRFLSAAIRVGAFRRLATNRADSQGLSLAILECYAGLNQFPNHRSILNSWLVSFRPDRARHEEFVSGHLETLAESEVDFSERQTRKPTRALEAFENVQKQKKAIIPLIRNGNPLKVRRFVDQLVESQLRSGDARYAAMSLCDLAQHAKNAHNFSLQLEFAKRAIDVSPEDGWAHGQLADAYLGLGQFDNAAKSLKMAGLYGEDEYARTGHARILRGQGKLEESLNEFTAATLAFPEAPIPWSGRAEVLREMWKYEQALKVYEEAIDKFPTEPVLRCGRAAVLVDLGRLVEALKAYSDAIDLFPAETVPRDGYADTLKEMGQLKEALEAYEENIKLSEEDSVALCGRAEVLSYLGRFDEALHAYNAVTESFPYVAVPYCGKAEVLREMGRLKEALLVYEDAVARFPAEARAHNGRANILKELGKVRASLQAYDQTIKLFPYDLYAWSGRADLLKVLGNLTDALKAYDLLIARNPVKQGLKYAKAAILAAMRQYKQAEELLPARSPETREDWIAYHIKGMLLLKRDMLSPAISHLQDGLRLVPFADQRKYFRSALAIATLRKRQYVEATAYLKDGMEPLTDVLRVHAFGELKKHDLAAEACNRLMRACPPNLVQLRDELGAKYGLNRKLPRRDASWVFEEECKNLLLLAA